MFFKKTNTKLDILSGELVRLHGQLDALSLEPIENSDAAECYLEIVKQIKFITEQIISHSEDKNVRR